MAKDEKLEKQKTEIGEQGYLNKNCWLVKNLNYSPYRRCQHCNFRFRNCLFLHYQVISLILIIFFLTLFFLVEGKISTIIVITIFTLVTVYGYFFNRSTEKIVKANFSERKAKEALEDLTEKLEEKVDEQTKDIKEKNVHLEKLLEMRSEFLDIASHQLKTPVSVILGTISMFQEGSIQKLPKEQQDKFINNIFRKAKKLSTIISDILRASEMDTDGFQLSPANIKSIQPEDIVKSVYDEMKPEAVDKGIGLELTLPDKPAGKILADPDFLEQAIYNLADNAIKYTSKGVVKIALSQEGGRILIKIADSGIGIPKADQKKMFSKFARAENAVDMYTDGSGLGLFIVKKIVEAHSGGQISFTSEEKKGTVFTISLPTEGGEKR